MVKLRELSLWDNKLKGMAEKYSRHTHNPTQYQLLHSFSSFMQHPSLLFLSTFLELAFVSCDLHVPLDLQALQYRAGSFPSGWSRITGLRTLALSSNSLQGKSFLVYLKSSQSGSLLQPAIVILTHCCQVLCHQAGTLLKI